VCMPVASHLSRAVTMSLSHNDTATTKNSPLSLHDALPISGGSGSGKTSVTRKIMEALDEHSVALIEQDYYYKDQSDKTFEERLDTNYDHPFAFDNDLLTAHIRQLLERQPVEVPTYNYEIHTRSDTTIDVEPRDVIIIEGIFALENESLRDLMDVKIYVDTDSDIRILRRLQRDIETRGRTLDAVINQYLNVVRPMHLQFIEPTKRFSDVIIPEGGENNVAIDLITTKIRTLLNK